MGATVEERGLPMTGDGAPRGGAQWTGGLRDEPRGCAAGHASESGTVSQPRPDAGVPAGRELRPRPAPAQGAASASAPASALALTAIQAKTRAQAQSPSPEPATDPTLAPGSHSARGPRLGPRTHASLHLAPVVYSALVRFAAFATCARARLGLGAITALSMLERVRGWSGARARAGEMRETATIPTFHEAAEIARKEWVRAVSYFDQAADPDLIDYATYSLRAAERKYVYLLKKAREESASTTHMAAR